MENLEELKLKIKTLENENQVLKLQNNRLKKDMYNAEILFRERNIVNRRMKQIKEEKLEQFNLFLKFCKESVIALDSDLRFIYSSDSFLKRIGYEEKINLKGMHLYDVYCKYRGAENALEFCNLCKECLANNEVIERQIEYISPKDGSTKHTTVAISPAINKDGELQNLVIVLKDVTEFYEMKEKAEESTRAKSEFLANMSHEIRTPMNAIVGMVELIMREDVSNTVREHVFNIKSASNNLLGIINDILDISKVESRKIEIIEDQYEIGSIINDITNMTSVRIGEKDIEFLLEIDPKIPYKLFGDEIRLRQIIINLVSNAIKFTDSGYVKLKVRHENYFDDIKLHVSVEDTGSGIREEDIEKIFESFKQVDTRKNRNKEGTGLGLAISKSLVELMGGSVSVKSDYGKGSIFSFVIPQKVIDSKCIAQVKNDNGYEILIFEEKEITRKTLRYTFESLGLNAHICGSKSEFDKIIDKKNYSHIFVPYKFIDSYKHILFNKKTKLNAIININEEYHISDNITYIQKPIYCLGIASIIKEESISSLYVCDKSESKFSFVAPEAKILVVDDNAVNLKVAYGLMSQYEMKIDLASSGFEALEMIKKDKYDLVFMDHMMPEMDGIDTVKAIRNIDGEYYNNLPIIAFTANAISGVREMFLANSMQDFLSKPIDTTKLNCILKRWIPNDLKKYATKINVSIKNNDIEYNLPEVDYEDSMKRNNLDLESYIDILKIFLKDGQNKIDKLNYFENEELKRYIIEVHAIKSSAESIGAYVLSRKAKALEEHGKSGDISYIKENNNEFILYYQKILDNIEININDFLNENKKECVKKNISKDELIKKVERVIIAIENFDSDLAKELLNEAKSFNLNEDVNEIISKTLTSIDMFEYDDALNTINSLINEETD